jgi:hypothetical protein
VISKAFMKRWRKRNFRKKVKGERRFISYYRFSQNLWR